MPPMQPRDRLILALDLPTVADAEAMIAHTAGAVGVYKIGYQLAFAGGLALAERLAGEGTPVFLDMKLHDIGNTVSSGVAAVAALGVRFLTVHGYPQTMQAAVEARGTSGLKLLAVTVLTSYNDADLKAAGYAHSVAEIAAERAKQARGIGVDGLVCSAQEATRLRGIVGPDMLLVTPGIRPAGTTAGDQKRVMTPAKAIAAGADYLVVGRPILRADDPKAAADAIVAEIAQVITPQYDTGRKRMPKGYWIAHVDVRAQDGYMTYVKALPEVFKKYGGRYVTRGGKYEAMEGAARSRNVIIEFPSYEQALACYRSPEYQAAAAHRKANADTDLMVVEGYDGPQPGD